MKLPRSVGFVRSFVYPQSVSYVAEFEARMIAGDTTESFGLAMDAPDPLLNLAKTIDFRSADPQKVEPFLESEYPKIRIAAQYALGWLDEVAVAETLFSAYGPKVSAPDGEIGKSPQSLLERLMLKGLLNDINVLMGTPPNRSNWFSSTPVLAKFLWDLGVSYGISRPSAIVEAAEAEYKKWQKNPRKTGLTGSTIDFYSKRLRENYEYFSFFYVLNLMDEITTPWPDGTFIDRMFVILKKHNPDEIYNIWPSAYDMLWNAGYRW